MIPELSNEKSSTHQASRIQPVQRHLVIGTWAMSRQEPHLFFWRDHNSYDNDPYITGSVTLGQENDAVARAAVIDSLVFEGIDGERSEKAIKDIQRHGTVVFPFLEEAAKKLEWRERRAPMMFVEVMPSVLNELTKKDMHLLLPASVLKPYSKWNNSLERRVEAAFKNFAAEKQPIGRN